MPPKRRILLAAILVAAGAIFFCYGARADVTIAGPNEAKPGQMVQLQLGGVTFDDFTKQPPTVLLICLPQPDLCVGAYLLGVGPAVLFQEATPGTYHTILATTIGGKLQLIRHSIQVGKPQPPNPPNPPDPPLTDWGKWSKKQAEKIDHPQRSKEARALAGAIRGVLAARAAGVISGGAKELREAVKQADVAALVDLYGNQAEGRARAVAWNREFDVALAAAIRAENDPATLTVAQHSQLYREIAEGLEKVQ